MAVIKTHLYNISFEHSDLMKMLIKMNDLKETVFPQDSKKIASNVKGVSIMDNANPYNEALDNLYHVLDRLNIEKVKKEKSSYEDVNLNELELLIEDINNQIEHIEELKENILKEKEENDEAIILLNNLTKAKISLDEIEQTKYIKIRFGKLPINEAQKIKYYKDYQFIYRKLNTTKQYVWIAYAGLTTNIGEIDNIFYSMNFEQVVLPQFAHGKVDEAIAELQAESSTMEESINHADSMIKDVKDQYQSQLLEYFNEVSKLKLLFDQCKYVVDFSHKAAIYAFSSCDINKITKTLSDIDSVKIVELPINIYENRGIISPVLVKNNSIVAPFENILSNQIGDTFDPTTLLALSLFITSALFIGDMGVGAVLFILGLLLLLVKKNNKFGGALLRLGVTAFIGGILSGQLFYQMDIYQPILTFSFDRVHHFILFVAINVIVVIVSIIIKKLTRKTVKI